ncbi:MAG: hypothetical protein IJB55_06485 [Firmicutes bacterium]|nr:hypothetical protein [Bacillota bacterium]
MSIMGMREWLRNNRNVMLIIFVLLLVALLITYGQFGQSNSYSEADYEAMIETAREAYNANPQDANAVYTLAQALGAYAGYLTDQDADRERIDEVDLESVKYYDEYYGLMLEQAKTAYETEPTYSSAAMVASYLNARIRAASYLEDVDTTAWAEESNEWMITAMELRRNEAETALQADPTNPALLADMADVKASLAYYKHEKDESVDMNAAYADAMALVLQALDNCPEDTPAADISGYYLKAAGYAQNMENTAEAEQYCRLAVEADPTSYSAQVSLASLLTGEARYAEAKTQLEDYLATLDKSDENYANVESSIEYLQMMMDAAAADEDENDDENEGEDTDAGTAAVEAQ